MDYTDGEATAIFNDLKRRGSIVAKDGTEVLNIPASLSSRQNSIDG
jgi:uncharacterized Zn ribbon protein